MTLTCSAQAQALDSKISIFLLPGHKLNISSLFFWACGKFPQAATLFGMRSFTRADWDRHVTWKRYLPEGITLPLVLVSLSPLILWSVLVSMAVGLYATYAEPRGWPLVTTYPDFITVFSLTAFALSLLMLFKTNSAYARWWEARTLLGLLYLEARSVMRMTISWVGPQQPHLVRAVYHWITAVMPSLCAFLRENPHYYSHLEGILSKEELQWLGQRGIPPIGALQVVSVLLAGADLSDIQRARLEQSLSTCNGVVGACERIQAQPMPLAYNRHTHRFLLTYITFLPFALWPLYKWVTLPVMATLAFLLLGVENIGIQIEQPFRVLPLDQLCKASRRATTFMFEDLHSALSMAEASAVACSQLDLQQGKQEQLDDQDCCAHLSPPAVAPPAGPDQSLADDDSQHFAGLNSLQPDQHGQYHVSVRHLLELAAGVTHAPQTHQPKQAQG